MVKKPPFTLDRDPSFGADLTGAETALELANLLVSGRWTDLRSADIANAPAFLIDQNPAMGTGGRPYPSGGGKFLITGWAERRWLDEAVAASSRVQLCLRERQLTGGPRAELILETKPKRGERRKIEIAFTVDVDGSVSARASMTG